MVTTVEVPEVTQELNDSKPASVASTNGAAAIQPSNDTASPQPTNGTASPQRTNGASASQPLICPRCDAQLRINYYEPQCLQCGYVDYGYVDYGYVPEKPTNGKKSLVGAGTQYILRYIGDFPYLAETLAYVKLERLRNRVVFGVECPFCSRQMVQSSLSGRRRELREERYKCTEGHRVSLTPTQNGSLGWK